MSDSAYPSVPPGHRYPASFSPDGVWWWDGYRWVSTISHDGRWRFNGLAWERLVPRQRLPRWLVITGVGWLTASAAWLVATTVILAVSAPKNPDRTAGITILVLGALGALATVAWGGLVGRRAATRWLWPAAAIGTGVQLFFYVTAMLAAPSNDGGSNDTAAGAGIVILTVPTAALILLLLWLGAAVGALSRMIKGRQPRSTDQCPGDRPLGQVANDSRLGRMECGYPTTAWEARSLSDDELPRALTFAEAFRAAYFMTEQYVALERPPDTGLVVYEQYLNSDPARWHDWSRAVRRALANDRPTDSLAEDLDRDERERRSLALLIDAVSDELHVVAGMCDIPLTEQQFDKLTAAVASRLNAAFHCDWVPYWVKEGGVHTWPVEGGFRSRCGACLADSSVVPQKESAVQWARDHEASHSR